MSEAESAPLESAGALRHKRRHKGWYALLLLQFAAVLWPPFFNRSSPPWLGLPFFYWYQLAWVILGALSTTIVYLLTSE